MIHDKKIYESTGLNGFSAVYEKELRTGKILNLRKNTADIFGEGLTVWRDRLYQLSWRSGIAFVYDLALKPLAQFRYSTEGWGLTHDGEHLIMSDGSARLYWRDARSFAATREVIVHDGTRAVPRLNELEYADGLIYANLWLTDRVAVITPEDGRVQAWIDFAALRKAFARPEGWNETEHVLNGIAHDPVTGHFFVTGKCWPVLFEIKLENP